MFAEIFNLIEPLYLIDIDTGIFSLSVEIPSCLRFNKRRKTKSLVTKAIINGFGVAIDDSCKVISIDDCVIHITGNYNNITFMFDENQSLDKVINTIKNISNGKDRLYIMAGNEQDKKLLKDNLAGYNIKYYK